MINKSNYEIYFLDYFDGSLPAEQVAELFLFLEQHHDLKAEFDDFENIKLTDDLPEEFPAKDTLKKTEVNETNIQQFLIAEFEGDLKPGEQKELETFINSNASYELDRTLYSKTKLVADASIKYPGKGGLKKTVPLFGNRSLIYRISIAASILLFMGIYFYSSQEINPAGNNSVAVIDNKNDNRNASDSSSDKLKDTVHQNELQSTIDNDVVKSSTPKTFADEKKQRNKNGEQHVANNNVKQSIQKEKQQEQIEDNQNAEQNIAQQKNPEQKQDSINIQQQNPVAQNINQNSAPTIPTKEKSNPVVALSQPVTVKEAVNNFANEKLARLTGNDDFANPEKKKNKKLDLLTWAVNKLGGKKVKMQTQYGADDRLADVAVTGKGFSIEHVKGF